MPYKGFFGSILLLSLGCKVDMAEVVSYSLTPLLLSLSCDGTILKTKNLLWQVPLKQKS